MARVTIEGSITPSTFLARGARLTVERTSYIDKLISRGYVTVVATPDAKTEVESITAPKLEAAKAEKKLRAPRKPRAKAEVVEEPPAVVEEVQPVVEDIPAEVEEVPETEADG
ncbi:hypothetical protein NTR1_43 [Nocardia phage NTR1]|nr:hypothetical protein NTR1_43 [Nocardia phage NTR1]